MTVYFEMDVIENSLYCIVIVTVTASSLSSLRRSNVDFPSGAAFLGDFLPSSKGSKPFPFCSSMTSMIAVEEEREKEKKKRSFCSEQTNHHFCSLTFDGNQSQDWLLCKGLAVFKPVCAVLFLRIKRMFESKLKTELHKETN